MKNFLIFLLPSRKQSHNVSVVCKDLPDTKFIDLKAVNCMQKLTKINKLTNNLK